MLSSGERILVLACPLIASHVPQVLQKGKSCPAQDVECFSASSPLFAYLLGSSQDSGSFLPNVTSKKSQLPQEIQEGL